MLKQTINLPINTSDIRELSKLTPLVSLAVITGEWLLIAGAVALHIWFPHPAVYLIAWIIIGTRMYSLYSLLHDGIHYLLFSEKRINDRISRLFLAWPLFISLSKMRKFHLAHHQHLKTPDDPEAAHLQYKEFQFPKPAANLAFTFLKDVTGLNFIMYKTLKFANWVRSFFNGKNKTGESSFINRVEPGMMAYYFLVGVVVVYMNWEAKFALYWLVPYITIYQALNRLRLSTEHFNISSEKIFQTRTVKLNFVERFIFSPHNLGFHTEHHLYPSVPFYRLPVLHKKLMDTPEFSNNVLVNESYFSVIKNYIK